MKTASMTRNKGQVYSVGNYLMTGKVLGKGHFARVEEATHRVIGKKVAIKIIDLTCIKEEYARRHLHREPRVMAKLRHPCIAALYETMMHGPRLYVVMEAAGGGDLCAHVLAARGAARGLPEPRARALAAQLVSAVRHMHARGVVHRDLKMENIMLDTTKQFIKIVDFGLSNIWSAGGALRTPCGSLEYAAPELFVDGRRYGPEVDLWSIGVIVYGMVTGGLPFTGNEAGEGKSRPQLRAAIARGFTRKQRAALACVSTECKTFIQQLLEPNVEARLKIDEAARHRWIKRPGMKMKTHPFGTIECKSNREIYKTISDLAGQSVTDVVAEIKSEPFGALAGMYNIKTHLQQLQGATGIDLLWSGAVHEPRPPSPPQYRPVESQYRPVDGQYRPVDSQYRPVDSQCRPADGQYRPVDGQYRTIKDQCRPMEPSGSNPAPTPPARLQKIRIPSTPSRPISFQRSESTQIPQRRPPVEAKPEPRGPKPSEPQSRPSSLCGLKQPVYKMFASGDCLPRIEEHAAAHDPPRPRRPDYCRRAGDAVPSSWRSSGAINVPPTRILLQTNATSIKRASLGNIVSPHSSTNSQCKSERSMPVGWYSTRSVGKEPTHLQRLRRTAPMK